MREQSDRSCSGCAACCTALAVVEGEFDKPPGCRCPHQKPGRYACTVYDLRPNGCRTYRCFWLGGLGGSADRPDKTGVVFDSVPGPKTGRPVIRATEVWAGASERGRVPATIRAFNGRGFPVAVCFEGVVRGVWSASGEWTDRATYLASKVDGGNPDDLATASVAP